MRTAVSHWIFVLAWLAVPACASARTPQAVLPTPPHKPLFDVRFVLRPAPRQPSALPAITLDERPAIRTESLAASTAPIRWFGTAAPNVERCYERGCEPEGGRPQRGR